MMFFRRMLPKIAAHWIINLYRAARKLHSNAFQHYRRASAAAGSRCTIIPSAADRTVVCDFHGGLLRSTTLFPYFMLVALEAGGYLRGLVLLLLYPVIFCMGGDSDAAARVMAMAAFCEAVGCDEMARSGHGTET